MGREIMLACVLLLIALGTITSVWLIIYLQSSQSEMRREIKRNEIDLLHLYLKMIK